MSEYKKLDKFIAQLDKEESIAEQEKEEFKQLLDKAIHQGISGENVERLLNLTLVLKEMDRSDKQFTGKCPTCGSENLHYYSIEVVDDTAVYWPWDCNECGACGKEVYDLLNGEMELSGQFAINDLQK